MTPARVRFGVWALTVGLLAAACGPGPGGSPGAPPAKRSASPGTGAPAPTVPDGVELERSTRRLADGSPVRISVISLSPGARVTVKGVHGRGLAASATVRSMAHEAGAWAAVNASYFDIRGGPAFSGYEGDPLGVYATGGSLLSEAANGRTALILGGPATRPRIDEVSTSSSLAASDGAHRELDGINRVPGRIVGCGGVGGDRLARTGEPVSYPVHNQLCLDPDEIVAIGAAWGAASPKGGRGSVDALLDSTGKVTALRVPAGGPVPSGGRVLSGIGKGAEWLSRHARPGASVAVTSAVYDSREVRLSGTQTSVIGAGPALVRDGRTRINAEANGLSRAAVAQREPRTVAGVTADGTLLLVTFDGRRPGISAGVSLQEAADLMVSMGAADAVNLDGGGSTTMVVEDRLWNRPTDSPGGARTERAVATALAVIAE
ncbi:phosphodiester glycosidase family protein [Streptomyces sp. NBC_00338]|uniref:phosphodiester glycosidase family protein n=1 Tax=unclassified Streptomyces TaxID=2593676 RepID=UPI002257D0B6|nr:phosphodiester glycosidase family protein [Streptomyces sp. NBC_00338]MCX5143614.1 phosphodiester glycosidase family protein [Streptomyces sp. NBC_00338]WSU61993.1 phosphodiester glycosidase family protein [Streptomyces sp. NBC_01104]